MPDVTMVSTPDDGSCGIGTYTGNLLAAMPDDLTVNWITVPLRSANPLPYIFSAFRTGMTADSTIHVQHEYGIYGPKSIWSWPFFLLLSLLTTIRQRRVIVTFHSAWSHETISPPLMPIKRLYVAANNRLLAMTTDHAVFLSENAATEFQRSVQFDSVETIPHGVQTDTRSLSQKAAKQELGYEADDQLIVLPGYIRPEKGCDAFVTLAEQFDSPFVLAGGCQDASDYCAELRERAPSNVKITGQLDEKTFHAAFAAADLVVLPYRDVTQSGVFNLCVAYEVPVLGSDTPYFRSLAEEWGCVDVVDTEEIDIAAERVRELLSDNERRNMLSEKMTDYRKTASLDNIGKHHIELYTTA
jgi:glycosyltransferase involved in cell wall biosynthesis